MEAEINTAIAAAAKYKKQVEDDVAKLKKKYVTDPNGIHTHAADLQKDLELLRQLIKHNEWISRLASDFQRSLGGIAGADTRLLHTEQVLLDTLKKHAHELKEKAAKEHA